MIEILSDGRLIVPIRAESEHDDIIGDGMIIIDQSHPHFQSYMNWIERMRSEPDESEEDEGEEDQDEVVS